MERPRIIQNRLFLYLTEFFSGMSVMAVELGASRLLAPYFSSSQIVWTIIIGTIMIAMALGNLYGGRKADRDPDPDKLYGRILIASLWIAAIPAVGKYIIIAISALLIFTVSSGFLVIAGLAACLVLFVFPLFLLGTVTPTLARLSIDSADGSGSIVGRLNAFNTIGSIIGTFLPTFVTIPAAGTSVTFLIFSGILLALCLVYFISAKGSGADHRRISLFAVLFAVMCVFGHGDSFAFWRDDLTYEGESVYNYLQVYEDDSEVVLSTNVLFGVQSVYLKEKGLTGMYYDHAMAAAFMSGIYEKGSEDILILGNGTGTFATQCGRYFDNVNITGVEIDGKITELAGRYFNLSDAVSVVTYDGRAYLNAVDDRYDVIMVDAYQDITIPFQMSSQEFFSLVRDHLKPDGVMVVNMNMRTGEDGMNQYLSDTISSVFSSVYSVDIRNTTNRVLFASNNADDIGRLMRNCEKETDISLKGLMERTAQSAERYVPGDHIMTDDRAPVELLSMRAIDDIIAEEVSYYRGVYEESGIQGLIDSL